MQRWKILTLTDGAVAGLLAIQRYRFLTIRQFARTAGFSFDASPLTTPRNCLQGDRRVSGLGAMLFTLGVHRATRTSLGAAISVTCSLPWNLQVNRNIP